MANKKVRKSSAKAKSAKHHIKAASTGKVHSNVARHGHHASFVHKKHLKKHAKIVHSHARPGGLAKLLGFRHHGADAHKDGKFQHPNNHPLINTMIIGLLFIFTLTIALLDTQTNLFRGSMLQKPQEHAPFDGTVMPIAKVPDYNKVTREERRGHISAIAANLFVSIPSYNINRLQTPFEELGSTEADQKIRQEKITFTIPYLGSYNFDWKEYTGGHPGVDIIVPEGTPVYAIANGVVYKAGVGNSAGNHIVLEHRNVPSENDPETLTTIRSVYEHLSSLQVKAGQVVTKGQLIGYSGNTGSSTAPHLHFQIDNADAPWSPYWPSNFNDPNDAGSKTYHPVNYVYKYYGYQPEVDVTNDPIVATAESIASDTVEEEPEVVEVAEVKTTPIVAETPVVETPVETPVVAKEEPVVETPVVENKREEPVSLETPEVTKTVVADDEEPTDEIVATAVNSDMNLNPVYAYNLEGATDLKVGQKTLAGVRAVDADGKITNNVKFNGKIEIVISKGEAKVEPMVLTEDDFTGGIAEVKVTPAAAGSLVLAVRGGQQDTTVEAKVAEGATQLFSDVATTHTNVTAINYLKQEGVINGYSDGTFKPEKTVTRAELVKIILEGLKRDVDKSEVNAGFSDVLADAWYAPYVAYAKKKQIVKGYSDGTFQPNKVVNRVEALKIALEVFEVNLPSTVETNPYVDADKGQWYAPYVQYAKTYRLMDIAGDKFTPTQGITRAEVAEMIYRLLQNQA